MQNSSKYNKSVVAIFLISYQTFPSYHLFNMTLLRNMQSKDVKTNPDLICLQSQDGLHAARPFVDHSQAYWCHLELYILA